MEQTTLPTGAVSPITPGYEYLLQSEQEQQVQPPAGLTKLKEVWNKITHHPRRHTIAASLSTVFYIPTNYAYIYRTDICNVPLLGATTSGNVLFFLIQFGTVLTTSFFSGRMIDILRTARHNVEGAKDLGWNEALERMPVKDKCAFIMGSMIPELAVLFSFPFIAFLFTAHWFETDMPICGYDESIISQDSAKFWTMIVNLSTAVYAATWFNAFRHEVHAVWNRSGGGAEPLQQNEQEQQPVYTPPRPTANLDQGIL